MRLAPQIREKREKRRDIVSPVGDGFLDTASPFGIMSRAAIFWVGTFRNKEGTISERGYDFIGRKNRTIVPPYTNR